MYKFTVIGKNSIDPDWGGVSTFKDSDACNKFVESVIEEIGLPFKCKSRKGETIYESKRTTRGTFSLSVKCERIIEKRYKVSVFSSMGFYRESTKGYKRKSSAIKEANRIMDSLDLVFVPNGDDSWRNARRGKVIGTLFVEIEEYII